MKKALKTAARGTVFPYAGEKWVVLEHDPAGRTLCLRLEVIPDKPFDEDNRNNFAISSSKEWMNGPYLDNLIDAVKGPHAFLQTELDLTADDGLKDYGTCTVTIFSLTVDQYRRNRDVIPLVDDWYWLSTAYSTAANGYEHNLVGLFDRYKALVIFDTETSGLNPEDDQIIELAALRVERTAAGALRIAGKMDTFIKLPEGEQLPENIVALTGITDRLLETEGVQSGTAVSRFLKLVKPGPVLMVAHNAQFDACFLRELLRGFKPGHLDWLDSLTVYKDRRPYANAGLKIINPDMDAVERRLRGLEEQPKPAPQRRARTKRSSSSAFDDW